MRAAKTFFYVAVGILALAIAFQMGAQIAQGQSGGQLDAGVAGGNWTGGVDASGMIWAMSVGGQGKFGPITPPKPGRIISLYVAMSGGGAASYINWIRVLFDDGDVWQYSGGSWRFIENLIAGGPTQATETTWGRIKADRR